MAIDQAYIEVEWDTAHTSPAIGPYRNITEARRDAAVVRRLLRENGRSFRRVHVHYLRNPAWMWAWDVLQPRLQVFP